MMVVYAGAGRIHDLLDGTRRIPVLFIFMRDLARTAWSAAGSGKFQPAGGVEEGEKNKKA